MDKKDAQRFLAAADKRKSLCCLALYLASSASGPGSFRKKAEGRMGRPMACCTRLRLVYLYQRREETCT